MSIVTEFYVSSKSRTSWYGWSLYQYFAVYRIRFLTNHFPVRTVAIKLDSHGASISKVDEILEFTLRS